MPGIRSIGLAFVGAAAMSSTVAFAEPAAAVTLYDQSSLITGVGVGANGANVSVLPTGNTILGFGASNNNRLAQSFTISQPGSWSIDTVNVFAYMTSTYPANPASPFTGISVNIWNQAPNVVGSQILGSSNQLVETSWTGIYRTISSSLTATSRPVMQIAAGFTGLTLNQGTYWVDYTLQGLSPTNGTTAFTPPLTTVINGQPVGVLGSALQLNPTTGVWGPVIDNGPNQARALPLRVTGTLIAPTPTAIPTPALLPGLVGMGAAALRKRKQEQAEALEA